MSAMEQRCRLSICISTFNGAKSIGETLASIIPQMPDNCEIVILDGGSNDRTDRAVEASARGADCVRYIRQETNNGVDRDFNRAVEIARGKYCWLMSDDDVLKPTAIATVLKVLDQNPSLTIVNADVFEGQPSRIICERIIGLEEDHVHAAGEIDSLFSEVGVFIRYIGCVVIEREIWMARDRASFFGTLFTHVGVIFQKPLPGQAIVIAEPLVSIRYGAVRWRRRNLEILGFKWPDLVWSLPVMTSTKKKVTAAEPWRSLWFLLVCRSVEEYSILEYRRWIVPLGRPLRSTWIPAIVARIPGVVANSVCMLSFLLSRDPFRNWMLLSLKASRFYFLRSRPPGTSDVSEERG